ncbi:MAG: PAS domain S-box protein, partial [Pseudomonadota bacterium]|nr:PAS domain S-box protein [Pseudomonadota bacterium]
MSPSTPPPEIDSLALRSYEQRLRDIRDNTFDAYIVTDAASRILEWNMHAERLFGWPRAVALGLRLTDTIIPTRHRPAHIVGLQHYLATGVALFIDRRIEIDALHRDGSEFPVELKIWAQRNDVGEHEFHAFVHDIGERAMANRRLAAQTEAAAALIQSESIAEAAPKLLQAVSSTLGWSMGVLWMVDVEQQMLRCFDVWHGNDPRLAGFEQTSRGMTFAPGVGLPGRIWRSGQPAWVADVTADDNFPRAACAAEVGLHGAFGFPVFSDGRIVAVVEFFSSSIQQPDPGLLRMMATLGNLLGQFIARNKAERALEQEGEFLTALLDNITEGIVACDEHGTLSVFNQATRDLHGLPEQSLPPGQWAAHYDLYLADGVTRMEMAQIPLFRAFNGEHIRNLEMVIAPKAHPRRRVV